MSKIFMDVPTAFGGLFSNFVGAILNVNAKESNQPFSQDFSFLVGLGK